MGETSRAGITSDFLPVISDCHQIWPKSHFFLKMTIIVLFLTTDLVSSDTEYNTLSHHEQTTYEAIFNVTYLDSVRNKTEYIRSELGRFGTGKGAKIKIANEHGRIVVVKTKDGSTDGCDDYDIEKQTVQWIALLSRGDCPFTKKIERAKKYNASAVVIYNLKNGDAANTIMEHSVEGIVAISIPYDLGIKIKNLVQDKGYNATMQITVGKLLNNKDGSEKNPSKTSVVFVSVSFIVLMIISLAWLVFYYIQRFRYAHAKERLARRLASAAKKAIAKIPQKTIKNGDKEMSSDFDQCAVCIEGYKAHDVIRTLPCKHVFHKSCVDPWLLDQRSCPMCKLDILRAYGMHVGGSEDSVHPDGESGNAMAAVEDLEQTSVGDETSADGEVKVLLLPQHVCFHHGGGETSAGGTRSSIDSSHATCDPSEECVHSSDSECTELHSLMDHPGAPSIKQSGSPEQKDSDNEDLSV